MSNLDNFLEMMPDSNMEFTVEYGEDKVVVEYHSSSSMWMVFEFDRATRDLSRMFVKNFN